MLYQPKPLIYIRFHVIYGLVQPAGARAGVRMYARARMGLSWLSQSLQTVDPS